VSRGSAAGKGAPGAGGPTALRPDRRRLRRRPGRVLYGIAFLVLLADGVAAIWLGQVGARTALVVVGVCLVLGALGLGVVYRRWQAALEEVEVVRRALRHDVEELRRIVGGARAGRSGDAPNGGNGGSKAAPRLDERLGGRG